MGGEIYVISYCGVGVRYCLAAEWKHGHCSEYI